MIFPLPPLPPLLSQPLDDNIPSSYQIVAPDFSAAAVVAPAAAASVSLIYDGIVLLLLVMLFVAAVVYLCYW